MLVARNLSTLARYKWVHTAQILLHYCENKRPSRNVGMELAQFTILVSVGFLWILSVIGE